MPRTDTTVAARFDACLYGLKCLLGVHCGIDGVGLGHCLGLSLGCLGFPLGACGALLGHLAYDFYSGGGDESRIGGPSPGSPVSCSYSPASSASSAFY
jgi:hypothetical protein